MQTFSTIPFSYNLSGIDCNSNLSFIDYMKNRIEFLKSVNRLGTADTYATTLRSLQRFYGKDLKFNEITPDFISSYELYLSNHGLKKNSMSFYMRILRAVFNSMKDSHNILCINPFKNVYTGIAKTCKRALSIDDVRRIKLMNLTNQKTLDFARDMFLFSFYTRGMSFIDMSFLTEYNIQKGYLTYQRMKTHQSLSIKWEECMEKIVMKYDNQKREKSENGSKFLLPIIKKPDNYRKQYKNCLHYVNSSLKLISQLADLPPISMYVARHSWASVAYKKHIPISVISEAMGHLSEMTTKIYLSSLNISDIDNANNIIISDLENNSFEC